MYFYAKEESELLKLIHEILLIFLRFLLYTNVVHLPVFADPSHATGLSDKVIPMARAAIAAGADGLMVEVHHDPEKALSDGPQALLPNQFEEMMTQIRLIAKVIGRTL
jgi:3-deoxy-7-phosphoheptulonate synthase